MYDEYEVLSRAEREKDVGEIRHKIDSVTVRVDRLEKLYDRFNNELLCFIKELKEIKGGEKRSG